MGWVLKFTPHTLLKGVILLYIEPNSVIKILHNCPLESHYEHTIYFSSVSAQISYFYGLTKYNLTKQSYQRVNKGTMRVEIPTENLYDCNYLMFQNTAFGNKWFYAFIDSVNYVNNKTSEISYTIDVMQTWFFDYELEPVFVDREHSATDEIGENTVPENLETGGYITTSSVFINPGELYVFGLATEIEGDWLNPLPSDIEVIPPRLVGGLPNTAYVLKIGLASHHDTARKILEVVDVYSKGGAVDALICFFTCPSDYVSTETTPAFRDVLGAPRVLSKENVKNNKLYTYPYCCNVSVSNGQGGELRYEFFENAQPTFRAYSGFGPNMKVPFVPLNYGGTPVDFSHTVTVSGYPILPFTKEYFQNWLAQNALPMVYKTFKQVVPIAASLFVGGNAGALGAFSNVSQIEMYSGATIQGVRAVEGILDSAVAIDVHSLIPDSMAGNAEAANIFSVMNLNGFYNYCKSIRPEYIDIIDGIFNMTGYATKKVKIPNRNVRPHWTFTRTIGCHIKGGLPQDDVKKICSIYDKGITFWKHGDELGNYDLDNRVGGD